MKLTPILFLPLLLGSSLCLAGEAETLAKIRQTLETRFPDTKIVDVRRSAMPGLYEVFSGDSLAYTDATGDYLILGQIMETSSKRNLTALRLDERLSIDFAKLPLEKAIKTVKGSGKRRLAVFSDPDCPFCQQLEKELASVTDVTIYTFLYPLAEVHPDAPKKALAIWCTANRSQAWSQWMLEKRLPDKRSCDAAALDDNQKLGETLHVNTTPTLFGSGGQRVTGVIPAAQIESLLAPAGAQKPGS